MKVYEAIFDEHKTEGVYALSLVEDPAMEDEWIALSKHPDLLELSAIDNDKRLLLGAALIPDKKIYRNLNGNEFYLTFTEKTIEKVAHFFLKNKHNNNSTLEHELKLEGMSVAESWVVENPKTDKSVIFGKEYPKGTWVVMMKVDNDDVWNKVKNGDVKGFSIEALLSLKETNLNLNKMSETTEKKSNFFEDLKAYFSNNQETQTETKEVEVKMFDETEIAQLKELVKEAVKEVIAEANEEPAEEVETEMSSQKDNDNSEIETLKAEFDALKEENESLKAELSKQPEAKAIKQKDNSGIDTKIELTAKTTKGRFYELLNNAKNN